MTVRRLIGVYNSKGTLTGELAYVIGRSLGRTRCALCDITHGHVRPKREWREQRSRLPVRFETYHLDDCPPQLQRSSIWFLQRDRCHPAEPTAGLADELC